MLEPSIDPPDNLGKELSVDVGQQHPDRVGPAGDETPGTGVRTVVQPLRRGPHRGTGAGDRKSTRLNSSHSQTSYAVFCLKKKLHRSSSAPESSAGPKLHH